MPDHLTPAARDLARLLDAPAAPRSAPTRSAPTRSAPTGSGGSRPPDVAVLADRPEVTVVRVGDRVAKAHAAGTDAAALTARLRLARDPALAGILLPPASAEAARLRDGRLATVWPYGTPVDPDDASAVPWEVAGRLLAALHAQDTAALAARLAGRPGGGTGTGGPLPPTAGAAHTARVVARMRAHAHGPGTAGARRAVERVWSGLPAWCRGEAPPPALALCHGDFHLGQLVRVAGGWRLIDVDDVGLGDPVWDLARPAAWYAAGLLPPEAWGRLLAAYRPEPWDPWPRLDAPARALTAHFAARSLANAATEGRALREDEEAFVDACVRIVNQRRAGSV